MWKTLERRELLRTPRGLAVFEESVALPDGRRVDDYLRVEDGDFATIVARDEAGAFLCLRQYRHGPRAEVLTLPGGGVDPGETPLEAAERELLEETGHVGATWRSLGAFVLHGARYVARGHHFLALGCRAVQAPASGDLETATLKRIGLEDMKTGLVEGRFPIMSHAAALGGALCLLSAAQP